MSIWPWEFGLNDSAKWESLVQAFKEHYNKEDLDDFNRRICPPGRFPQSSGTWESLAVMVYSAEGAFVMERLPPYQPPTDWRPDPLIQASFQTSYETKHFTLAALWLEREKRVTEVDYEVEFPAGVADIASLDGRWFVECGGSRPSKVLDLFKEKADATLVFFNEIGITSFRAGPRVKEYQESVRRSMRKSINKMKPTL